MPPYGDASLHTKDDLYGSPDADIAVEPCGDELVIESDVVVENNFDDGSISRHTLTSEIDQVVASSEQPITDHPIVVNLPVDVLDDVPSAVVSTLPTEHMSGSPQKRPLRRAVRRFADADTTGHGKPPPVEVGRPT
jgi:hypothetical protein